MKRTIEISWSTVDVQERAADAHNLRLNDAEAWKILRQIERDHDAGIGINWEVLDYYIKGE